MTENQSQIPQGTNENSQSTETSKEDILNAQVGENESRKVYGAVPVVVASVRLKTHTKENKKMDNPLAELYCKHPESEELIKLSKISFLRDKKVTLGSLFSQTDTEHKLMKDSVIARLLNFANVTTLNELVGKEFATETESESSRYLVIKAY